MNARTLRRAAERKARKWARKANANTECLPASEAASSSPNDAPLNPELDPQLNLDQTRTGLHSTTPGPATPVAPEADLRTAMMTTPTSTTPGNASAARIAANHRNAQRSTGPRTEAGKARASANALKTGLTGRTVLLPADDVDRYREHVQSWAAEYNPVGPRESTLVQAIADSYWRTDRIVRLEFALFAQQSAAEPADTDHDSSQENGPGTGSGRELEALLRYEKQLRNLHIQEARLNRQREKDTKELRTLQAERRERERERERLHEEEAGTKQRTRATETAHSAAHTPVFGFEFSTAPATLEQPFHSAGQRTNEPANETARTPAAAA